LGSFEGRSVGFVLLLLVVVAVLAELVYFFLNGVHVDVVHAGFVLDEMHLRVRANRIADH
jgi:hypothetical protein